MASKATIDRLLALQKEITEGELRLAEKRAEYDRIYSRVIDNGAVAKPAAKPRIQRRRSGAAGKTLDAIEALGGRITAEQLATRDEITQGAAWNRLNRLAKEGVLVKIRRGVYGPAEEN